MVRQPHRYSPVQGVELNKTEARQANSKTMNVRVLLASLLLATVSGAILIAAFWRATTPAMDHSSGGLLESTGPAPAAPAKTEISTTQAKTPPPATAQ